MNHIFRNVGLKYLENILLIDVYERLIPDATEKRKSQPYLCYKIHIPW